MPSQAEDHAWRDFRTPRDRLAGLPDPQPGRRDGPALFARIAAVLAAGIDQRVWRQGEKLPPSATIAERFRTSTDTARAALRALIEQGYAERQPGGATWCKGTKVPF